MNINVRNILPKIKKYTQEFYENPHKVEVNGQTIDLYKPLLRKIISDVILHYNIKKYKTKRVSEVKNSKCFDFDVEKIIDDEGFTNIDLAKIFKTNQKDVYAYVSTMHSQSKEDVDDYVAKCNTLHKLGIMPQIIEKYVCYSKGSSIVSVILYLKIEGDLIPLKKHFSSIKSRTAFKKTIIGHLEKIYNSNMYVERDYFFQNSIFICPENNQIYILYPDLFVSTDSKVSKSKMRMEEVLHDLFKFEDRYYDNNITAENYIIMRLVKNKDIVIKI